jgi:hypothetical protein
MQTKIETPKSLSFFGYIYIERERERERGARK